jgi:hypothetical protein
MPFVPAFSAQPARTRTARPSSGRAGAPLASFGAKPATAILRRENSAILDATLAAPMPDCTCSTGYGWEFFLERSRNYRVTR